MASRIVRIVAVATTILVLFFCDADGTCSSTYGGQCQSLAQSCSGKWVMASDCSSKWCCVPLPIDPSFCQGVRGQCLNVTTCNYTQLNGYCSGIPGIRCCLPNYTADCANRNGSCLNASATCLGTQLSNVCGPKSMNPFCCVLNIINSSVCISRNGVCQDTSLPCNGTAMQSSCDGNRNTRCCILPIPPTDDLCVNVSGGVCQGRNDVCVGPKTAGKCKVDPTMAWCCEPKTISSDKCQQNGGQCQNITTNCTNGVYTDRCDSNPNRKCCLPLWLTNNDRCRGLGGSCNNQSFVCNGTRSLGTCNADPNNQWCCFPPNIPSTKCLSLGGACVNTTFNATCAGYLMNAQCDNQPGVLCCVLAALQNDNSCTSKGGTCTTISTNCTNGRMQSGLCFSNSTKAWCCLPGSIDAASCSRRPGTCQDVSVPCSGTYINMLCNGVINNTCCQSVDATTNAACLKQGGVCVGRSAAQACNGVILSTGCNANASTPICCVPKAMASGSCTNLGGVCQNASLPCTNGTYQNVQCDGNIGIDCCIVPKPKNDNLCTSKSGTCINTANTMCATSRLQSQLCFGDPSRPWCCLPTDITADTCASKGGNCTLLTGGCAIGSVFLANSVCSNTNFTYGCCVNSELASDAACFNESGVCGSSAGRCSGNAVTGMCFSDPNIKWCCLPKIITAADCQKGGGVCQAANISCPGRVLDGLCGGVPNTACCVQSASGQAKPTAVITGGMTLTQPFRADLLNPNSSMYKDLSTRAKSLLESTCVKSISNVACSMTRVNFLNGSIKVNYSLQVVPNGNSLPDLSIATQGKFITGISSGFSSYFTTNFTLQASSVSLNVTTNTATVTTSTDAEKSMYAPQLISGQVVNGAMKLSQAFTKDLLIKSTAAYIDLYRKTKSLIESTCMNTIPTVDCQMTNVSFTNGSITIKYALQILPWDNSTKPNLLPATLTSLRDGITTNFKTVFTANYTLVNGSVSVNTSISIASSGGAQVSQLLAGPLLTGTMKLSQVFTKDLLNRTTPVYVDLYRKTKGLLESACVTVYPTVDCLMMAVRFFNGSIVVNYTLQLLPWDNSTVLDLSATGQRKLAYAVTALFGMFFSNQMVAGAVPVNVTGAMPPSTATGTTNVALNTTVNGLYTLVSGSVNFTNGNTWFQNFKK